MTILVTGAAGFIGYHLCASLLKQGHTVVGLDHINAYYDVALKYARLSQLGIEKDVAEPWNLRATSVKHPQFSFVRVGLEDQSGLSQVFQQQSFHVVCNLAAQAGVRYSLENPQAYMNSNMVGFLNILECCRKHHIQHLVYASSSSVYGLNQKVPFETSDRVDQPISLYAATKKSNELMAHTYSHLFGFATTGLRFFTVYGPWGRPDMAYFSFTERILSGEPIPVFNEGQLSRDFTYIDDIVNGLVRIIEQGFKPTKDQKAKAALYNIGRGRPVSLLDFIGTLETKLGKKAQLELLPMQEGDVHTTWADTTALEQQYGYAPQMDLKEGLAHFVDWYTGYHN
jgi:UDP-glucuronate 4-epimerase